MRQTRAIRFHLLFHRSVPYTVGQEARRVPYRETTVAKMKKTYRLDVETVAAIASIAERGGMTATEVIEAAVRAYGSEQESTPEPTEGHEASMPANDVALDALVAQLNAKDVQIDALMSSLATAQQLADQAQRLQAAALPPAEEKQLVSVPLAPTRLTLRERLTGRLSR